MVVNRAGPSVSTETTMKIEIWSDIACPSCYIGKHRLDTALSGIAHAGEVEVVWRSYQLDPNAPRVSDMGRV
jgi:predicted DsbA family dithiol-disulfide isomerase